MKPLLLVFLISTLYAQEDGAIKMLRDAKHDVVITASYVAEATQYLDNSAESKSNVHSIPTAKHGGQVSVSFNNSFYQIACLTSMLYRSRYQELSLYVLTMFLPTNQDTMYMPGAWYSSYVSSLASYKGDTSSVWLFRLGKYGEGTEDHLGIGTPGGYAFAWEAQVSKTMNATESATNKPMVSVLGGLVRKPKLSNLYLNWDGSAMVGVKAAPWAKDTQGNKALYLQTLLSFTLMTGFYHPVWYGMLSGDVRASIDQQIDMRLGGKEDQYSDNTQSGSWSTLSKVSAKLSYSF